MSTPSPSETPSQPLQLNRQTLHRFTRAVRVFARSPVGGKAKLFFAALIVLLLVINGLNVVNSYVGRDFMTAVAERSMNSFVALAIAYLAVFAASTVAAVMYRFSEERLGLLWREWLTRRLLNAYLEHPTSYRLSDRLLANGEVANPDQRIADDVRSFTTTTLSFLLLILNGTLTVIAFSGVMWSISPLLFIIGVVYAAIGSLLTIWFGRPLVGLNYAQLDKEASFRAELVHLRENAESVAMARYEQQVLIRLTRRLIDLCRNMRHIIGVNRNVGFFTTGYNYLIQILPALIVAPSFIRGEVEFGVITQSAMAFSQLLGAFSLIVTQFQSISSFTAVIARVGSLAEAIEQAQAMTVLSMEHCHHHRPTAECPICFNHGAVLSTLPTITTSEADDRIAFERLTLRSPQDERVLVAGLTLSIPLHTRVLILGDNDAAKIALFRATAGIWEIGDGRVIRPHERQLGFLPERPFLPPGTLRQFLVPPTWDHATADEKVGQLTNALQLTDAVTRAGLDSENNWTDVLSLGEQQLLAAIRLILATPQFAFLDRPQTILTAEQVQQLLGTLNQHDITYVTIGERNGWQDRYDAELELKQDGSWTWTPRSNA